MGEAISFFNQNIQEVQTPRDDAIIASMMNVNYDVKRILIYNETLLTIYFIVHSKG